MFTGILPSRKCYFASCSSIMNPVYFAYLFKNPNPLKIPSDRKRGWDHNISAIWVKSIILVRQVFKSSTSLMFNSFCVQFACNWYGNYGHNGHYGQFYGRIVDCVDTMDAITLCGQQTVILLIRLLQVRVLPGALDKFLTCWKGRSFNFVSSPKPKCVWIARWGSWV